MAKLKLTVACGAYDIVKPLMEGTVEADGLELIFLTDNAIGAWGASTSSTFARRMSAPIS
jgi:hypothetical protein